MAFAFEMLQVYQNAIELAAAIRIVIRVLPHRYFFLRDQLSRAALSIAANITESNGRFTKPDRKNFFGIARGSVQELKATLEEIAKMLSGLINGLDRRQS